VVLVAVFGPRDADVPATADGKQFETPEKQADTPKKKTDAPEKKRAPERRRRATLDELLAEVPDKYVDDARMLLGSTHSVARQVAGETIAKVPRSKASEIPEYIRDLAQFETAANCDDKKVVLDKFDAGGEVRALSALKIIADTPSDSCSSWLGTSDCLACLRDDLRRVIGRFEAETR
jgi:hypothetical protein